MGIAPSGIRIDVCATMEITKQMEQETHSLFGDIPARSRLKSRKGLLTIIKQLQTTQPTSGGAATAVTNCSANYVEPSRPQQWVPDLPFIGQAGHTDRRDGSRCSSQTRVMSRLTHYARKQISIRCNRIEHWVHLRCAGIRQAQYTDTWTCHLHR